MALVRLSQRFERMRERLAKAALKRTVKNLDFVIRKLNRRGICVNDNLCQTVPTMYLVKEVEFIGPGAACLIHACNRCMNGDRYFREAQNLVGMDIKNLTPFTGMCSIHGNNPNKDKNGANRLIIIPDADRIRNKKLKCPFWIRSFNQEIKIGSTILEHMKFEV